jgi:hypothetical protein
MLSNPIYIGQIRHKEACYPGQHKAIINQALWDQVQRKIADNRIGNKTHYRKTEPALLHDKLFDKISGEKLVTIHANKKGKRYRYYVSRSLAHGTKDAATSGWRLPGQEIDRVVIHATTSIIRDREAIIKTLTDAGIKAHEWSRVLKTLNAEDDKTIAKKLLQRVQLQSDGITLTLSLDAIIQNSDPDTSPIIITKTIPMQMKRRGIEMRMIVTDIKPVKTDPTLIRTIIKAHGWLEELLSGKVATLGDIAKREGIDKGAVSRVINLAFLAPDIVEAILVGHQPAAINTQKLVRKINIPINWAEQRRILHAA